MFFGVFFGEAAGCKTSKISNEAREDRWLLGREAVCGRCWRLVWEDDLRTANRHVFFSYFILFRQFELENHELPKVSTNHGRVLEDLGN